MATSLDTRPLGLTYVRGFTEAYKKGSVADIFTREQLCEDVQFPAVLIPPRDTDYLCGKRCYPEVGYSPQYGGMGYYFNASSFEAAGASSSCMQEEREEWRDLKKFWDSESTEKKCWAAFHPIVRSRLGASFEDAINNNTLHENAAYTHYRMSGLQMDFGLLVEHGIQGLMELVKSREEGAGNPESVQFYQAVIRSLERVERMLYHYVGEAEKLPETNSTSQMIASLKGLTVHSPETFHEALQLILLFQTMTGTLNFGRLDTVMGPFLVRDLEEGRLTWDQALAIMKNLYSILNEEILHFDARIIIGGKGRPNEEAADLFALLAMDTTDSISLPMPQVTLRFYMGQNPALIEKAYDVIGHGKTFPMLYNDDVNIPSVMRSFGVDEAEAEQYIPFGCGEYIIDHRSSDTPNFFVNLQMCLAFAMNNGCSIQTGKKWGPDHGALADYETFDDLWRAYAKTVDYYLEAGVLAQETIYTVTGRDCPYSLISLLYDDCLSSGKPIFNGGIRYLGGTNETYGNTNAADSLTAINELIYQQKIYTPSELMTALKADWVGYGDMRKAFRSVPKFGNDNDTADDMVQRVHQHICTATAESAVSTTLHHFLVVVINNNFNTLWGKATSASPDGRKSGDPLAPGNAPSAGADRNGLTALLNSQAKPDPSLHAGAVQNVKLSADFPCKNRELYHALFRGYFRKGGAQAMITVTSRKDLLAALEQPENYANLLVRVGGFSARFIDLDSDTQREILSRTEHEI